MKTSFWSIFCFLYQIFVNFWRQKNPNSKMVHRRKISTTEVRGNKRFFYTQSGVGFWFRPLFGKMIAAPPGWSTFREKIFIWANSVIIHSLKNMFKVPGGIRWQFFPVQMKSEPRCFLPSAMACILWVRIKNLCQFYSLLIYIV